jgi:hypothetical protein
LQGGITVAKKSTCPITRAQFRSKAKAVKVVIDGKEFIAAPKEFSTNSLGWNVNEKVTVEIDGVPVTVQVGMNMTIIGSKELPLDAASPMTGEAPA